MSVRRSHRISKDELRELLQVAGRQGILVCRPTVAEKATVMAAPYLLAIARRRGYRMHLSEDHQHIEFDVDAPLWHALAVAEKYTEVLEHMQADFLGSWDRGVHQ